MSQKPHSRACVTHTWRGLRCRIIERGPLQTVALELESCEIVVTSRDRLRRLRPGQGDQRPNRSQLARIAILGASRGWDHEDVLFVGFERGAIPWLDSLAQLTHSQASALIACLETPPDPIPFDFPAQGAIH